MIGKLLPLVAAIAVALVLFGPARQYLPGAIRLESGGALVTNGEPIVDEHHASGIGLAPAPVLNPAATAARLTLSAEPLAKAEHGYAVVTTVVAPDGKPLADASVKFFELVDLFGQREMLLSRGTTDGRGVASFSYLPAQTGHHVIVARSATQGRVTAGEGRMTLEASVAAEQPRVGPSPFSVFSDRVPYVAGLIVLTVWGLIAFALLGTARGVIGDARGQRRKGEIT